MLRPHRDGLINGWYFAVFKLSWFKCLLDGIAGKSKALMKAPTTKRKSLRCRMGTAFCLVETREKLIVMGVVDDAWD